MMNQSKQAVCSLIINDEGLILAAARKDNPNIFGLPGGKVEDTDLTLDNAAKRELVEETGLRGEGGFLVYSAVCFGDDNNHYMTHTFMWHTFSFTSKLSQQEGEGRVCWVSPDVMCKKEGFGSFNFCLFKHLNIIEEYPALFQQPGKDPVIRNLITDKWNYIQEI